MIRISLVHYLNAAPLGWSFLHGPLKGRFEVTPSSPARCAEQLATGEVDVGIIPSIEYQRIPDLEVVPGIAIGATAKVRSVILVRYRNTHEVRSVALDTNSRTSVALATLLLRRKMRLNPEFVHRAPDPSAMLRECDAALIIGDAALKVSPEEYEITDLAEAWVEWQDKPFVFAVWACRRDRNLPDDLAAVLQEAKEWGCGVRREIAGEYGKRLGLPQGFLEEYLRHNVDYDMTARHVEGLERFYQLAFESGIISHLKPVRFLSTATKSSVRGF